MWKVGLESRIEEVWTWLIYEKKMMMGIYGIGGVGKTTLLKQIYNKLTIFPDYFDIVIWVTVSQNLSEDKVLDDIWKRIGVFNVEWVDKTFEQKAEAIHGVLSEKKLLLLLDDLGEPLDLAKVGILKSEPQVQDERKKQHLEDERKKQCLEDGRKKPRFGLLKRLRRKIHKCSSSAGLENLSSAGLENLSSVGLENLSLAGPEKKLKVIFTTRSEEVCRQMGAENIVQMISLQWGYAWELFRKTVGEDRLNSDPRILELAQTMARTCKGLPMLLCTVAGAMKSLTTYDECLDAIKGLQFQEAEEGGKDYIFSLLQFCFRCLDTRAKSLLFCYSLFPEDFTILKNELIDFWICQRILSHDDIDQEDVLNLGYEIVHTLIGARLLEEEEINHVKLLDLIRDFASEVSRSSPFLVAPKQMELGWVLPMRNSIQNMTFVSPNFFTFLLKHNPFIMVQDSSLPNECTSSSFSDPASFTTNCLTVLDLSHSAVEEIPRDIANLVSLESLNLSHTWIDHLPIEIKMLTKLKCLNLEYDEQLRVIPKQLISGMTSLLVLKMFRCGFSVNEIEDNILSVTHMDIDPIFCLEHLKVLSITITCAPTLRKFFSNHKLLNCTQSLSLEVFWDSKSLDISPVAAMKNLLTLEIHQVENVKELNGFPPSFGLGTETRFEKLREITLEDCSCLLELTWVIQVPNLTILKMKNCQEIEEIISMKRMAEIPNSGEALETFGKLEILVLESLPKLQSIYWKALHFQCLKKIEVTDCYSLKKLPLNSDNSKANEVIIEGEENWWMDIEWENDVTRDTFLPCFKPVVD